MLGRAGLERHYIRARVKDGYARLKPSVQFGPEQYATGRGSMVNFIQTLVHCGPQYNSSLRGRPPQRAMLTDDVIIK